MIKTILITAMKNHNVTPNNKDLTPTVFKFSRDNPAPIKNKVSVKHWRETFTIDSVTF